MNHMEATRNIIIFGVRFFGHNYWTTEWLKNIEHLVEWKFAGETEVLGENSPQYYIVHDKSQTTWHGIDPRPPQLEAGY
jgi:hypothetical protein